MTTTRPYEQLNNKMQSIVDRKLEEIRITLRVDAAIGLPMDDRCEAVADAIAAWIREGRRL